MKEFMFDDEDFMDMIDPEDPLFVIGVVSEMVNIPLWTLRKLDEMGIVEPERKGKRTRCYSMIQIKKLNYIYHLMNEKGVNISGVKIILDMSDQDLEPQKPEKQSKKEEKSEGDH